MGYVQKVVTPGTPIQLYDEKQVSVMLDTPVKTLQRWRCVGDGPPFLKFGRRVKYDSVDIQTYVNQGRRYPSVRATQGE
jgi:hypothetical protein